MSCDNDDRRITVMDQPSRSRFLDRAELMRGATGSAERERTSIAALTGLRFVAAFAVLLFHSGAGFTLRFGFPTFVTTALNNGYLGVSLFFILSGFVLTYKYDGNLGSRDAVVKYGVFRFARIYPVYLLALLLALPLVINNLDLTGALSVLFMIQSWNQTTSSNGYAWIMQAWSLSCEAFFYLCFPVLLFLFRSLSRKGILLALMATVVMIVGLALPGIRPGYRVASGLIPEITCLPLPLLRLTEFVYGMLLCKLMVLPASRPARQWQVWLTIAALGSLMAAWQDEQVTAVASALFGVLIYQLATVPCNLGRFLSNPMLVLLGGASYAIYLLAGPIREWVRLLIPLLLPGQFLYPILVIAISVLVFLLVEEPARKIIRLFYITCSTTHLNNRVTIAKETLSMPRGANSTAQPRDPSCPTFSSSDSHSPSEA